MADHEVLIFDPPPAANVEWERAPLTITGAGVGDAGQNQINRLVTTASGGTFTVSINGASVGTTYSGSASAGTIQTTLEARADVAPGDVIVTGGPLGSAGTPVFIEWTGAYAQEVVVFGVSGSGTTGLANTMTQGAIPASPLRMEELDLTPPAAKPDWVGGAFSEAQLLNDVPLHENRVITIKVRVDWDGSYTQDQAFDEIGKLIDRIQAAPRKREGIPLQWTSSNSTRAILFDVLMGEVTGMPISWQENPGWFFASPLLEVKLTCKPYGRDTAETFTSATSTATPILTQEVTAGGDVPAEGRLIITDNATQARRDVEWGLESAETYDSSTALIIDSDALATSGFSGSGSTRTGAYDPGAAGNSVIRQTTVGSVPTAMCGTGTQSHIGSYRVWARVYMTTSDVSVRFAWRVGDSQYSRNAWATSPTGGTNEWVELDLGTIIVQEAITGTSRWDGRVEMKTSAGTATVDLDYLMLVPTTHGYGRTRAVFTYSPGVVSAYDDFESMTLAAALNSRAAPLGGSWATSGAATDFTCVTVVNKTVSRSTTSDAGARYAILGSTNYTDVEVSAVTNVSVAPASGSNLRYVIARYVDSSNFLYLAYANTGTGGGVPYLLLSCIVGSSPVAYRTLQLPQYGFVRLRLIAYASGLAVGQAVDSSGNILAETQLFSSVLATGGTLATGKPGIADQNGSTTALARYYDEVNVGAPAQDPTVIFSGRIQQIRYDDTLRQETAGLFYGTATGYRGTRFYVPPGTGRVGVVARRVDRENAAVDNVTDSTTILIGTRDRFLAVPR